MKKKLFPLLFVIGLFFILTGCEKQAPPAEEGAPPPQTVELTVWCAEEDMELMEEIAASFQSRYAGEASFRITCQPQSESTCKDVLLGDLEAGADVFAFADDQVSALAAAGDRKSVV